MPERLKSLNHIQVPVRWVDLDAYGHVSSARYFDCMAEARADFLADCLDRNDQCQIILVDTQCNYKKAISYPSTIVVYQYLESIGQNSFTLFYKFYLGGDPSALYAEGRAKNVCYDPSLRRTVPVPEEVRRKLLSTPVANPAGSAAAT